MTIEQRHITNTARARELYLDALRPKEASADWHFAVREARKLTANALRDSRFLSNISAAIEANGGHTLVFRQLLAPPLSQDQCKLICPPWNKTSENKSSPTSLVVASAVSGVIVERLDRGIVPWKLGEQPSRTSVITLMRVAATLMALQKVATARRKRLALEQERAVVQLLERAGWSKLPSQSIDTRAAVPRQHFMHKTRFATRTTTPQEVDIACGLANSFVLAMECKVTNDETNSVKRINDVLKKATAWKDHWGSFVVTAALLQGVIAAKDVQRLSDAGVKVFGDYPVDKPN